MGVAAGDYDNDGWVDLFVTAVGQNTLLRNVGGRFHDVTAEAGVGGAADQWSTCATWFDADNDGDLDLFVCRYVRWSRAIDLAQDFSLAGIGRAYGPPRNFAGAAPAFYVNDGDGRFAERAAAAGLVVTDPVTKQPAAKSLGVALVAPRRRPLPRPRRRQRHGAQLRLPQPLRRHASRRSARRWVSPTTATATRAPGMGIDAAEVRDDGAPAVAIGNFANEMTAFFVQAAGSGQFVDEAIPAGSARRAAPRSPSACCSSTTTSTAGSTCSPSTATSRTRSRWCRPASSTRSRAQLYWNAGPDAPATFVPVAEAGGLAPPMVGPRRRLRRHRRRRRSRPAARAGGRARAAAAQRRGRRRAGLRFRLVGTASNARRGRRVEVHADGASRTRRRLVSRTHGYLSQSEPLAHLRASRPASRRHRCGSPGRAAPCRRSRAWRPIR